MEKVLAAACALALVALAALLGPTLGVASHARSRGVENLPCRDESGPPRPGRPGPASGSGANHLAVVGRRIFFAGCDRRHGWELWRSDGRRTHARRVADIREGRSGSAPDHLLDGGGTLYFTADDGVHGAELWRSDGRRRGTRLVADVAPGPAGSRPHDLYWSPSLASLFFVADDGVHGDELWVTDGTADGTHLVADLEPGPGGSAPGEMIDRRGTLFFVAGTFFARQVYALVGGRAVRVTSFEYDFHGPRSLVLLGDSLILHAEDRTSGAGLWRIDDPAAGASRLDLGPGWPPAVRSLTASAGVLHFVAPRPDLPDAWELWRSDGTRAGTARLSEISAGNFHAEAFREVAGKIYLYRRASDESSEGLWISDGTVGGIRRVKSVVLGTCGRLPPGELVPVGDRIFFVGHLGVRGELWVSDGTADGTHRVRDILPGPDPSKPRETVAFGDRLAFTANDGRHGRELWVSDGTEKGTYMVRDVFRPGRRRPAGRAGLR